MTDQERKVIEMALEALERSMEAGVTGIKVDKAIAALRQALEQPQTPDDLLRQSEREGWRYAKECEAEVKRLRQALEHSNSDSAKHFADSADSFCQQELYNLQSVAGRMALELECLLLDTKDLAVVSRWWGTGMEALQAYRDHIWSITHGKDGESND